MERQSSPEIEAHLLTQYEGKLFEHLWMHRMGDVWVIWKDSYTVLDGLVYLLRGPHRFEPTGDTLLSLSTDCAMVGEYDSDQLYPNRSNTLSHEELKAALGVD